MSSVALEAFASAFGPLLSESAVARRLDMSGMRLSRAARAGKIKPDATAGAVRLYRSDRLGELLAVLKTKP